MTTALFHQHVNIKPEMFEDLHNLIVGGETLSPDSAYKLLEHRPPQKFINAYGPTETTVLATVHEVTHVDPRAIALPIGKPLANTTNYVTNRFIQPVPIGVV